MGWLLPSGNQLLWIRPQFESIEQRRLAIKQQIKQHKISIIEGVVEQTHWGDESSPIDQKTWFSVAYDPDQKYWIARSNPDICQGFMKGRTGAAKTSGADLLL